MRSITTLTLAVSAAIALGLAQPAVADHHESDAAEAAAEAVAAPERAAPAPELPAIPEAAPPPAIPEAAPPPEPAGDGLSVIDTDVDALAISPSDSAEAAAKAKREAEERALEQQKKLLMEKSTSAVGADWDGGGDF